MDLLEKLASSAFKSDLKALDASFSKRVFWKYCMKPCICRFSDD